MKQFDAGQLFAGRKSGVSIAGYDAPHPSTPAIDPSYIPPQWAAYVISWFTDPIDALWVSGDTGCGKSALIRWIAAKLNYPLYEITGHGRMEMPDLVGHTGLVPAPDGNGAITMWIHGPLPLAMQEGGIFLFNEIDLVDPSVLAGLNTVLDGRPLYVPDRQEYIQPNPAFRFIVTANSNGSGENIGLYTGILNQNYAFQSRFCHIHADYLSQDMEMGLVQRVVPGLPDAVYGYMKQFVSVVRGAPLGDTDYRFETPIGTRDVLRWAHFCRKFASMGRQGKNVLLEAMNVAFGNRQDSGTRAVMHEVLQRITAGVNPV